MIFEYPDSLVDIEIDIGKVEYPPENGVNA